MPENTGICIFGIHPFCGGVNLTKWTSPWFWSKRVRKRAKCLPVETGRNRQRRRRTVPNIGENKNSRKLLYLNDWSDPEHTANILFSGKYQKNKHFKYVPNFFPQFFSLANFFQIPGSGSKLGNTLDFEGKKKKKRKRRIFEFFSEFYLLIQGYNHICSGFLCACDPTIKTNRSVQSKEIDVRNSHKKVAYRAPAAQLKMTSGSPQLYPMP